MSTPPPQTGPNLMDYKAYVRALREVPGLQRRQAPIPGGCREATLIGSNVWESCIDAVCREESLQKLYPTSRKDTLDFFAESTLIAIQNVGAALQTTSAMRFQPEYIRYSLIKTFKHVLCEDGNGNPPLLHLSREALSQLSTADTLMRTDHSMWDLGLAPLLVLAQPWFERASTFALQKLPTAVRANPIYGLLFYFMKSRPTPADPRKT